MTVKEFEGRTEREAVARAAAELGNESFDVEVVEKSGGLFGRSKVRIRVKPLTSIPSPLAMGDSPSDEPIPAAENPEDPIDPPPEHVQQKTAQFAEGILERMGYPSTVKYKGQDGAKIFLEITTEFSNIIIGKRGKNLDALQLLVNVYLVRIVGEAVPWRIILDLEGYRTRQEKALVRTAHRVADEVLRTGSSQLLEPMNPFERRLVHTAISTRKNLVTRSDGEGLYKRIEIISDRGDRARSRRRR